MESELRFRADHRVLPCKYEICGGCSKSPAKKQKYAVCKGCKMQPYCSKECQTKDWKDHKTLCRQTQSVQKCLSMRDENRDKSSDIPSRMERYVIVRDFWRVHKPSFQQAVTCMRKSSDTPLNIATDAVIFCITYRRDNEGNPALMYNFETFLIANLQELFSAFRGLRDVWDAGLSTREKEAEVLRNLSAKNGQKYMHHLPIGLCVDGELDRWVSIPLFHLAQDSESSSEPREKWLAFLNDVIKRGLVFETHPKSLEVIMGKMVQIGREWRWRACTPSEKAQFRRTPR